MRQENKIDAIRPSKLQFKKLYLDLTEMSNDKTKDMIQDFRLTH